MRVLIFQLPIFGQRGPISLRADKIYIFFHTYILSKNASACKDTYIWYYEHIALKAKPVSQIELRCCMLTIVVTNHW